MLLPASPDSFAIILHMHKKQDSIIQTLLLTREDLVDEKATKSTS
jgi:hypothetical protein